MYVSTLGLFLQETKSKVAREHNMRNGRFEEEIWQDPTPPSYPEFRRRPKVLIAVRQSVGPIGTL